MKKFSSIAAILIAVLMPLCAMTLDEFKSKHEPTIQPIYRSMAVGGSYDATVSVAVSPIIADISAPEGTPFNMLGNDLIASDGYVGRKIATWTLVSNKNKVNLKITPTHLVGPQPNGESEVPYVLYFHYLYPTTGTDYVDGHFTVASVSSVEAVTEIIVVIEAKAEQAIYINAGDVRVYFPSTAMADIRDDVKTPPGTYYANVAIEVWSE